MSFGKLLPPLLSCALLVSPAIADEFTEKLKESAMREIEKSETDALFKQAELSQRYVGALKVLEARLTAAGDLDAIIRVREEAESVTKSGEPTAHADASIVELRDKYVLARNLITKEANDARTRVVDAIGRSVKEKESALTKAGQVEEALSMRKDGEQLLLELSSGMQNQAVEFSDDPRATAGVETSDLRKVEIPNETPPLFEKPFSIKGRWLESMTLPPLKQRVSEKIAIGDRGEKKWPLIVIPKGSVWSGKDTAIAVGAGRIVATKSSFQGFKFYGDLACNQYFINCLFDDCGFAKGGNWYGWDQAAKFYFENCVVTNHLSVGWNITDHGVRAENSVFEKIDLPTIVFHKQDPANYVNHAWMKFSNCRFVNCKVPSSFAAITRDCVFQDCTFVDDPKFQGGTKPFEVVLYLTPGSRWNITKAPATLTFTRKPDTEWKGQPLPAAQALKDMMGF